MTTAHLLSGPLDDIRLDDGRRRLQADLVVDLGVRVGELHVWAYLVGHHDNATTADWRVSPGHAAAPGTTQIRVPAGFETDYSSVPGPAWFVGRFDQHDIAGVVHDALYRWGAPRAAADRVWRIIARSGKRHVNAVQGFLGWAGLRVGGWVAWRRYSGAVQNA
jgi:hypothetical protein